MTIKKSISRGKALKLVILLIMVLLIIIMLQTAPLQVAAASVVHSIYCWRQCLSEWHVYSVYQLLPSNLGTAQKPNQTYTRQP